MFSVYAPKLRLQIWIIIIAFTLNACNKAPYNDFEKEQPKIKRPGYATAVGALVGAVFGATFIGAIIGGASVTAITAHEASKTKALSDLSKDGIQFVQYGDICTLIVPTDRYYIFNSPEFNNICYKGLNDIVRLLSFYPKRKIYIAAFTDDVDYPYKNLKLSQARAETMLTFLWAHDIPAEMLDAKGFAERFDVGDNKLVRGSAYNRRIEIQWYNINEEKRSLLPKGFRLDKKTENVTYK